MPVGSYPVPPKRQTDRFGQSQILASPKNSTPNATLKKWNFQLNLDNTRTITPKPKAFSARRHTPSKVAARVGGGGSISARGTRGTQNMVKAVKRRPKVGKLSLDKIVKTSQPHWPSSLPSSSRSGPNSFRSGGVKNARKGRFKMKNGTFVEPMSARCFSEAHRKESNGPLSARGRLSSSKKKGKISPDLKQAWATSHSSSSDGQTFRSASLAVEVQLAEKLQQIQLKADPCSRENMKFEAFKDIFNDVIQNDGPYGHILDMIRLAYETRISELIAREYDDATEKTSAELSSKIDTLTSENEALRIRVKELELRAQQQEKTSDSSETKTKHDAKLGTWESAEKEEGPEVRALQEEIKNLKFKMLKLRTEADLAKSREAAATKAASDLRAKLDMQELVRSGSKREDCTPGMEQNTSSERSNWHLDLRTASIEEEPEEAFELPSQPQPQPPVSAREPRRHPSQHLKIITIPDGRSSNLASKKEVAHKVDTWRAAPRRSATLRRQEDRGKSFTVSQHEQSVCR